MRPSLPPPMTDPFPRSITVSSGWNLRLAFLYGSCTRLTLCTISWAAMDSMSTAEVSPSRPSTVECSPYQALTFTLFSFSRSAEKSSTCRGVTPGLSTMIIRFGPFSYDGGRKPRT